MFANNSFRGYSPELEMTGSFPKIEISRISHGSDLRSKKKTRYPAGKSTLAQNFCQWASFSTPTGFLNIYPGWSVPAQLRNRSPIIQLTNWFATITTDFFAAFLVSNV
jgi:hypothetical protein